MKRAIANFGGLVFGTTIGGLAVGLAEALYRSVSLGYAMLLYGTLWAIAGAGLSAALAPLWRNQQVPRTQIRWGLVLSVSPSLLVLVRFAVLRDFLQEAPHAGWLALGAGLAAAIIAAIPILLLSRNIRRHFTVERVQHAWLWIVPLIVVVAFAVRAQAGDDPLPERVPDPSRKLAGRGVVLVVFDALRADVLGAYGADAHRKQPASPNFDELADRGLLFADTNAQASWTRPAVASLITSRHVSGHNTMAKSAVLPGSLPTLASVLQGEEVATAAVVTNYNLEAGYGFARGFDSYRYLAPARYLGAPERANRLAAYNVYRLLRERLFKESRQARHFYRSGQTVNAVGMQVLDEIGDGDFFLYLHYMEPHDPFFNVSGESWAKVSEPHPPAAWAPRMLEAYRDEVHRSDRILKELTDALEARGLGDRVTLVVTADHGEEFADHAGFYHGTTLYEEQLHVPLLMVGHGIIPGVDTSLARQIDIAPTIASLYGMTAPPGWEGRDLLGQTPPPAATIAEENHEGNVLSAIRKDSTKLILANPGNPRGLAPVELYNLDDDPQEQLDLAEEKPERVATLREELNSLKEAAARGGAAAGERKLDAEAEAELRALGYME